METKELTTLANRIRLGLIEAGMQNYRWNDDGYKMKLVVDLKSLLEKSMYVDMDILMPAMHIIVSHRDAIITLLNGLVTATESAISDNRNKKGNSEAKE